MAKKITEYEKLAFASSYTRANGQPIDDTSVWNSLTDAQAYAKTNKAYTGQILTVLDENNNSTVYVVDKTGEDSILSKVDAAALAKADEAKGIAEGRIPMIEGIEFSRRNSAQTSSIENGRVTIQDDKTATAGINKMGQIEPMGLTALYDTGKVDSNNKNIKQWTTLCINPAQITVPKIQHITMYLSNNIVLRNGGKDSSSPNSTIYLNHLGYHNISNITIYDYTDDEYVPSTYSYSDGAWSSTAIESTRGVAEFNSVDTAIGKIKVLNEVGAGIDWSKFKIKFDVEMEENYVYLPQKSGTLAIADDMPTFKLSGHTLNITLPE